MFNIFKKFRERRLKLYMNKALSHINPIDERKTAIRYLARLHHKGVVAPLMRIALDEYSEVQAEAAEALGKIGDQTAIETLTKLLVCKSGEVRKAAAESLVKLGEPNWSRFVMGDSQDFVRLGKSGEKVAAELLLESAKNRKVSLEAAEGLIALGDKRIVEPLILLLEQGSQETKKTATMVLGKLGDRRTVEPLVRLLRVEQPSVKIAAVTALGELRDNRALEPLCQLLKVDQIGFHEKPEVKKAAVMALGRLGDRRATEVLIEALFNSKDWDLQKACIESLVELGDERAVDPLLKKLPGSPIVAEALGKLGDERAVEPLIIVLLKPNIIPHPESRSGGADKPRAARAMAAANALSKLADKRAIEPLITALKDSSWGVREAAAKALARLAPSYPELISGRWSEIYNLTREPHDEFHKDSMDVPGQYGSSDCHSDIHTDTGIGLDFPEKPPSEPMNF